MILARVLGNIVATQKNSRYENARVMLCEQITPEGEAAGRDAAHAAKGVGQSERRGGKQPPRCELCVRRQRCDPDVSCVPGRSGF